MPNPFWNICSIIEQMEIKVLFKLKSVRFDSCKDGFKQTFRKQLFRYLRCVNLNIDNAVESD